MPANWARLKKKKKKGALITTTSNESSNPLIRQILVRDFVPYLVDINLNVVIVTQKNVTISVIKERSEI